VLNWPESHIHTLGVMPNNPLKEAVPKLTFQAASFLFTGRFINRFTAFDETYRFLQG